MAFAGDEARIHGSQRVRDRASDGRRYDAILFAVPERDAVEGDLLAVKVAPSFCRRGVRTRRLGAA
jgi:hypothetical protein